MRAQILHLSGPSRGLLATYEKPTLRIGAAADADIALAGVAPHHAEIAFHEQECCFYLRSLEGRVFVNQREATEVILEHGDLIELGEDGPKLRFRIQVDPGTWCKPVRQMIRDANEIREIHGLLGFVGSLAVDAHRRTTLGVKIAFPLLVAGLVFLAAYGGGWLGGRRPAHELERRQREQAAAYEQELSRVRQQLEELRKRQDLLVSKQEVENLRAEFDKRAVVIDRMIESNAALKRVLDVYSRGVCLVHGVFGFEIERAGTRAELRDRDGTPLRIEYVGSAFLASGDGSLITNRHVAEPWWHNEDIAPILQLGYAPRFVRLDAVCPGKLPVPVDPATVRRRADDVDIAALKLKRAAGVPVLPLFEGDPQSLRGEHVIVLGYPTGVNALLAKAAPRVVRDVTATASNLTELIAGLARRNAITPVVTQGALNEVLDRQLVYDATTTAGGSGGPVFGAAGTVIGVNFAVLKQFGGSNFGVPIRFAKELLPDRGSARPRVGPRVRERAGWSGQRSDRGVARMRDW